MSGRSTFYADARRVRAAIDGMALAPDELRRIEVRRGAEPSRRVGWGFALAGAFAGVLLLSWVLRSGGAGPIAAPEPIAVSDVVVLAWPVSASRFVLPVARAETSSPVAIADQPVGLSLRPDAGAQLETVRGTVVLISGALDVAASTSAPEVEQSVAFAYGTIHFVTAAVRVEQQGGTASIVVHSGSVRFEAADGNTRTLAAGSELRWAPPRRTKPAIAKVEDEPAFDVGAFVRRFAQLRSQGRYEEAAALAADALAARGLSSSQRRTISYDLGVLLSDRLRSPARACRHWRSHADRFASDPKRAAIASRLAACPNP